MHLFFRGHDGFYARVSECSQALKMNKVTGDVVLASEVKTMSSSRKANYEDVKLDGGHIAIGQQNVISIMTPSREFRLRGESPGH